MIVIQQERSRFLIFFVLLTLLYSGRAKGEERSRFTIETTPGSQGSTVSKIWGVATSIKIMETVLLPNTCDKIAGTVNLQDHGSEVFVTLTPTARNLAAGEGCVQRDTPVVVTLTIPDMPFIPGCHHHIRLETPEKTVTDTVIINW